MSDKIIVLSRKTKLTVFSRDAVGDNFKQLIPLKDVSSKYPTLAEDIKDVVRQLSLTKFHWVSMTPDYVAFFRSGGLVTDTILVHLLSEKGLQVFERDFTKDGPKIQERMALEKDWLFIYTD